jgi:hypothetical protein
MEPDEEEALSVVYCAKDYAFDKWDNARNAWFSTSGTQEEKKAEAAEELASRGYELACGEYSKVLEKITAAVAARVADAKVRAAVLPGDRWCAHLKAKESVPSGDLWCDRLHSTKEKVVVPAGSGVPNASDVAPIQDPTKTTTLSDGLPRSGRR